MRLKVKKYFLGGILLLVLAPPTLALAETLLTEITDGDNYTLNVPIGNIKEVAGLEDYIKLWYNFVIGVVGIIATVIIMWGGFKWLTSRGNSAAITDAKDRIWSAVIGLILVFLSYTILSIINPKLLTLSLPTLKGINIINASNDVGDGSGSVNGSTSGSSDSDSSNCSSTDSKCNSISALDSSVESLGQKYADLAGETNSVYRPDETRHGSRFAVDYPDTTDINSYVQNSDNWDTNYTSPVYHNPIDYGNDGQNLTYYLNDGSVFVYETNKEWNGSSWVNSSSGGYHWHAEFTNSQWQFTPY